MKLEELLGVLAGSEHIIVYKRSETIFNGDADDLPFSYYGFTVLGIAPIAKNIVDAYLHIDVSGREDP